MIQNMICKQDIVNHILNIVSTRWHHCKHDLVHLTWFTWLSNSCLVWYLVPTHRKNRGKFSEKSRQKYTWDWRSCQKQRRDWRLSGWVTAYWLRENCWWIKLQFPFHISYTNVHKWKKVKATNSRKHLRTVWSLSKFWFDKGCGLTDRIGVCCWDRSDR